MVKVFLSFGTTVQRVIAERVEYGACRKGVFGNRCQQRNWKRNRKSVSQPRYSAFILDI